MLIQDAFRGVVERGERWREAGWQPGYYLGLTIGCTLAVGHNGQPMKTYVPTRADILSTSWQRVPEPTKKFYLMIPCPDYKGSHHLEDKTKQLYRTDAIGGDIDNRYQQAEFDLTEEEIKWLSKHSMSHSGGLGLSNRLRALYETMQKVKTGE